MGDNEEIQLKDIIFLIKDYIIELYNKKFKIIIFCFLIMGLVFFVSANKEPNYKAELTFVVEDDKVSNPISSMSGIASQFGFDALVGGTSTFSQQNIMHLLKSRGVLSKTLLEEVKFEDNYNQIIEHYISIYNLDEHWGDDIFLKNLDFDNSLGLIHDSIITIVFNEIISEKLNVEIENDETNIISMKASNTIKFLQSRADSVFLELESSERDYARTKDINQRIIKASGRLKELQLMRNVEVLNTMYLEIIKNLEISKMTLLNQTPIIQVIDQPILPLRNTNISIPFILTLAFFGSLFLSSIYFIFYKMIRDSLDS